MKTFSVSPLAPLVLAGLAALAAPAAGGGSLVACSRAHPDGAAVATPPPLVSSAASLAASPEVSGRAEIGKPAPDFTLNDLDGHPQRLAALRGKTVVLEWFNPQCPFVGKSHTKGSLRTAASRHASDGVVWLAIDSAAPGRQGFDPTAIREGVRRFGLTHPVLRDETGAVGHAYGATNTPHLFVIDKAGTLVYAGAIDNSPDAEGESAPGGVLVNYVDAALEDLAAGRAVRTPRTPAYGCSVKYGS
jgi:peroxiredoxin